MLFHFAASVIMDSPNLGDWHRDHTGGPVVAEEWIGEKIHMARWRIAPIVSPPLAPDSIDFYE